jgi:hypothetical protein
MARHSGLVGKGDRTGLIAHPGHFEVHGKGRTGYSGAELIELGIVCP